MCTNQNIHYLDSGITWLGPICITVSTLREYQTHSRSCRRYSSPSYPSRSRSSAFTSVRPPPGLTVSGKENWPTFTFCTLYGNARLPTNSPPPPTQAIHHWELHRHQAGQPEPTHPHTWGQWHRSTCVCTVWYVSVFEVVGGLEPGGERGSGQI